MESGREEASRGGIEPGREESTGSKGGKTSRDVS